MNLFQAAALCVLCAASYHLALSAEFTFDDHLAIEGNADCNSTDTSVWALFRNDFWGNHLSQINSHKSYRPFTALSFRLQHMLHEFRPFGYHLVNVVLHGIVCLQVHHLYRQLLLKLPGTAQRSTNWLDPAFLGACLFAVHPVHTESVTSVVGRAELMCSFFLLLGLEVFVSMRRSSPAVARTGMQLVAFVALFVASLLSKETGLTLVGICFIHDVLNEETHQKRLLGFLLRCAFLCACGAGYLAFRAYKMGSIDLKGSYLIRKTENPFFFTTGVSKVMSLGYLQVMYFDLLVFPLTLCCEYSFNCVPVLASFRDTRNLATVALCVGLLVALYRLCFRPFPPSAANRLALFALGWTIGTHLPASNLLVTVGTMLAERCLYVPSIGFCLLVALLWHKLLESLEQTARSTGARAVGHLLLFALVGVTLTAAGVRTHIRNRDWLSDERLFESAIRVCPNSAKSHQQLGLLRLNQHRIEDGRRHFVRASEIHPEWCEPYFHLGKIYAVQRDWGTALRYLRKCAACPSTLTQCFPIYNDVQKLFLPNNVSANHEMAEVFEEGEHFENAVLYYREAGVLALRAGETAQALLEFDHGLRVRPQACDVMYWTAKTHQQRGDKGKARAWFQRAVNCGEHRAVLAAGDELLGIYTEEAKTKPSAGLHEQWADLLLRLAQSSPELRAAQQEAKAEAKSEMQRAAKDIASPASGVMPTGEGADAVAQRQVVLWTLASQRFVDAGVSRYHSNEFEEALKNFRSAKKLQEEKEIQLSCIVDYWLARTHLELRDVPNGKHFLTRATLCPDVRDRAVNELQYLSSL